MIQFESVVAMLEVAHSIALDDAHWGALPEGGFDSTPV